ncbi:MAG: adenylosuccinate lyase [Desulfobacteraceae bacterium 4572_130]|nr:MAG: adenylosuccinate lyase [Desulfobacteraceae bacterium 4572_130]
MDTIKAISVIDGRYSKITKDLREIFSEYGLIKHRVYVEIEWLKFILKDLKLVKVDKSILKNLDKIKHDFNEFHAKEIKKIEKKINHDVKAVEYFIKDKLRKIHCENLIEWVHFACTSDDINNISHALMLKKGKQIIENVLKEFVNEIEAKAFKYKSVPMMSRTHGQPATPTTVGKEFVNFAWRICHEIKIIKQASIQAKINGTTGNYNAHFFVFPDIEWIKASKKFLSINLGLEPIFFTTQINPNLSLSYILHSMIRSAATIIDFNRDMWGYISLDYFKQHLKESETGSSIMPHKINPIDFENSEGNMGIAISMMEHFSVKLAKSRFQRDLSDSTVLKSIGTIFGYYLIGIKNSIKGLKKITLNQKVILKDIQDNPELLAEPFQTAMRVFGEKNPYERLKKLTRGKKIEKKELEMFVNELNEIPFEFKEKMKALKVEEYTGLAEKLVEVYFSQIP